MGYLLWGGDQDHSGGVALDNIGNIIILGTTYSTNAITTLGSHQAVLGGFSDAFIAKFNSNGVRQWATYYGGIDGESGNGIAVDQIGNINITGSAGSTNGIATIGAHQMSLSSGGNDAFIAKFNANGVRQWATYYGGGGGNDFGESICADAMGNIILTGLTTSVNAIATVGTYQINYGGGDWDAFVVKFNGNGVRQLGTYYGGTGNETGIGIAVDVTGNIIITGYTTSANAIATTSVHQTINGGGYDVFIAKLSATGMLPVKLISFNTVLNNKKVNCTWETASEINNDFFTIERSIDGDDFESIGTIKGKGNSSVASHYNFTDYAPLAGTSYYRLKQTDFDGKYTYSDIQKVGTTEQLNEKIALHYVNGNPIINIQAAAESMATLELIDLNGITLFTQKQPVQSGENSFAINGEFNTGLCVLKVQLEDKMAVFKVWMR